MEPKKNEIIKNQTLDAERALYDSHGIIVADCSFDGIADGESALKESSDIEVVHSYFNLRYPFWHDRNLLISDSELTQLCRAALWYSENIEIKNSKLHGIKALRECSNVIIRDCSIISPEFGWSVNGLYMLDCVAEGEYFMMRSENLKFKNVHFKGKYSFQYIKNAIMENCVFETKDAFWHAQNVTVKNSVIRGEYLAWYSDGLTLENCEIIGTQPLCYCKNLKLINCKMFNADLCFEKSDVDATIVTPLISIKNPSSGTIRVVSVEQLIMDDDKAKGKVIITGDK